MPAPTVDQLCGKLTSAPVERCRLTTAEAAHPLDHFRWVRAASIASWVAAFAWAGHADQPGCVGG